MRLICGLLRLDGAPATEGALSAMANAMTAPGLAPAVTQRLDGELGLAVLDFGGKTEGIVEREGWLIAADARLDRARPVEAALTDAILSHGPDFPDHIDGDFALALWRRDARELWLGRDFIGVRPLAWTWQPGRWLAFASLPKGLHGSGLASQAIAPVALCRKIVNFYFVGPDSGFAEIAYLEAGHSLCIRPQDTSPPKPHRAYRPRAATVGTWRGTPEQAAENLRRLVQEAVADRLPPAGTVACHLTGGLDSSAITVLAAREARLRGLRVVALTMTTPEARGPVELDERPLIGDVLAQEVDVTPVRVHDVLPMPGTPEDPDWLDSMIGGSDDLMMARAADFGTDRVLSGVGGDEGASYNGANLYLRLLREGHLLLLAKELPARARGDGVSSARGVIDRLIFPLLSPVLRRALKRSPGVLDKRRGIGRYLNASMLDKVHQRRWPVILQRNDPADRVRAFADHHIPSRCTYYAIMAARHGLSVSFPLLDRRIVDFVLSLPVRMFLADGQSRQPFRRAMRGVLPERVRLAKNKVGLFDDRFVRYASLKPGLLSAMASLRAASDARVEEMFDLDAIQVMLELLPEAGQEEHFVRSSPGALAGGHPPWVLLAAVQCLISAFGLSRPSES